MWRYFCSDPPSALLRKAYVFAHKNNRSHDFDLLYELFQGFFSNMTILSTFQHLSKAKGGCKNLEQPLDFQSSHQPDCHLRKNFIWLWLFTFQIGMDFNARTRMPSRSLLEMLQMALQPMEQFLKQLKLSVAFRTHISLLIMEESWNISLVVMKNWWWAKIN